MYKNKSDPRPDIPILQQKTEIDKFYTQSVVDIFKPMFNSGNLQAHAVKS